MGEVVKYKRFVITYSVRSSDDPNLLPEVQHGAFNDINEVADGLPKGTYSRKELKTLLHKTQTHPCLLYTSDAADE